MIDKRFKVHSMIQGMEIGETMDLELCEELIKKYGSSSDIDLLIEDNGKNMTYQEVVDLLNENEQLKQSYKEFEDECQSTFNAMNRTQNDLYRKNFKLKKENEQLKQFKEDVFTLIDKEITRNEEAIEWGKETGADSGSIGYYNQMLNRLKKELSE